MTVNDSDYSLEGFTRWADTFLNFEKLPQKNIFWLDTMQFLCGKFGHPEQCCPAFHIAGSKGKGSVSAMISSILEEAGYSTGLYTSPHIIDFAERIGTAHGRFSDQVYAAAAKELMQKVQSIPVSEFPGERPVTWFELVTLYAFICFRQAQIQCGVYEVGLGGRLDATNVLTPKVCCITAIELEHTEFLGDTVEKIAAEKGGIIKEGVPVVIAAQKPSVRAVFEKIAADKHAPVIFVEDVLARCDFSYSRSIKKDTNSEAFNKNSLQNNTCLEKISLDSPCFNRPIVTNLRLFGAFQAQNAALAAIAVKQMYPVMDESVIERGLSKAILPGRFEVIHPADKNNQEAEKLAACCSGIPALILDGAHTVNSVTYTMDTFRALYGGYAPAADSPCSGNAVLSGGEDSESATVLFGRYESGSIAKAAVTTQKAHLLFACAADKKAEDIAPLFAGRFDAVTLTKPGMTKAADLPRLEKAFNTAQVSYKLDEDYKSAISSALKNASDDKAVLLVTGSFYLVAEVKKFLLGK